MASSVVRKEGHAFQKLSIAFMKSIGSLISNWLVGCLLLLLEYVFLLLVGLWHLYLHYLQNLHR